MLDTGKRVRGLPGHTTAIHRPGDHDVRNHGDDNESDRPRGGYNAKTEVSMCQTAL